MRLSVVLAACFIDIDEASLRQVWLLVLNQLLKTELVDAEGSFDASETQSEIATLKGYLADAVKAALESKKT